MATQLRADVICKGYIQWDQEVVFAFVAMVLIDALLLICSPFLLGKMIAVYLRILLWLEQSLFYVAYLHSVGSYRVI